MSKKDSARPSSPRASVNDEEGGHTTDSSSSASNLFLAPKKSGASKAQSDRVTLLLSCLEFYDSLYLCPSKTSFPDAVASKIKSRGRSVRKYEVKDYFGETRFYAVEFTPIVTYYFCSNSRPFEIFMFDPEGTLIFESIRENSIALCLFGVDCCLAGGIHTSANFRNQENYIGGVISNCSCSGPSYIIQNEYWDEKFDIIGPRFGLWLPCRLCCIKDFTICVPRTNVSVGKIIRGYDGLTEELIPNKDTVGIIFPPRCTAAVKACLVAAGFMLDVTYFHNYGFSIHRCLRYFSIFMMFAGFLGLIYLIARYQHLN